MSRAKSARELAIGDKVLVRNPEGTARVASIDRSPGYIAAHSTRVPIPEPRPAVVVDIEILSGPDRGTRAYCYVHPEDKVILA